MGFNTGTWGEVHGKCQENGVDFIDPLGLLFSWHGVKTPRQKAGKSILQGPLWKLLNKYRSVLPKREDAHEWGWVEQKTKAEHFSQSQHFLHVKQIYEK